jgi:hypothetical protein
MHLGQRRDRLRKRELCDRYEDARERKQRVSDTSRQSTFGRYRAVRAYYRGTAAMETGKAGSGSFD